MTNVNLLGVTGHGVVLHHNGRRVCVSVRLGVVESNETSEVHHKELPH